VLVNRSDSEHSRSGSGRQSMMKMVGVSEDENLIVVW
jgi:hypothetical protein